MSSLEFYTVVSALWVGLAWLPYVLDRTLVRGIKGALANPSPDAKPQSAWAIRAKAAHSVAVELLVAFGPVAVIAMIRLPNDAYSGTLAMTFFVGLLAHYIFYMLGIPVLRTLAFLLAALSTLGLALHLLGVT